MGGSVGGTLGQVVKTAEEKAREAEETFKKNVKAAFDKGRELSSKSSTPANPFGDAGFFGVGAGKYSSWSMPKIEIPKPPAPPKINIPKVEIPKPPAVPAPNLNQDLTKVNNKTIQKAATQAGSAVQAAATKLGSDTQKAAVKTGSAAQAAATKLGSDTQKAALKIGTNVQKEAVRTGSAAQAAATKLGSDTQKAAVKAGSAVQKAAVKAAAMTGVKNETIEKIVSSNVKGAEASLSKNVKGTESSLSKNIKGAESSLSKNIKGAEASLSKNVKGLESSISSNVKGAEASLSSNVKGAEATISTITKAVERFGMLGQEAKQALGSLKVPQKKPDKETIGGGGTRKGSKGRGRGLTDKPGALQLGDYKARIKQGKRALRIPK